MFTWVIGQTSNSIGNKSEFKSIEVETGIIYPIGNLEKYMNTSVIFGVWKRNEWSESTLINYGGQFFFPKHHNFNYVNDPYESNTKSFAGNLGARMDKKLLMNDMNKVSIISSTTFGYGFYFFDDIKRREEYDNLPESKKGEDSKPLFNRPFSTIHFGQSIKINYKQIGVFAQYSYTPYYLFSKVIDKKFGEQAIMLGITYRQ